jgi:hypothetical protein
MAFYVVGLSHVARRESSRGRVPFWPLLLLFAPVIIAMMMNTGEYRKGAIWISAVLVLWLARCLYTVVLGGGQSVGWIVTNLLAGIVFVDWLAVAPQIPPLTSVITFLALFGLTKWFQRYVPAT